MKYEALYIVGFIAVVAISSIFISVALTPSCRSDEVMVRGFGFQPYVCVKGHG